MTKSKQFTLTAWDEIGQIEITLPNGDHYTSRKVEDALSFLRRELAYRTAPTSDIWDRRGKES